MNTKQNLKKWKFREEEVGQLQLFTMQESEYRTLSKANGYETVKTQENR